MFIGSINSTVRKYLASVSPAFQNKTVVVGCSGNFTSEGVFTKYAQPAEIHSNDVSLYSCMLGRWLAGESVDYEITDPDLKWVTDYFSSDVEKLASLMVLLNMLQYVKQKTAHQQRMWLINKDNFGLMVSHTAERLQLAPPRITTFYAGDVSDHFKRFENDRNAVFCCYAPTYAGGYEQLYKALDAVTTWDEPTYSMLDEEARDKLLAWMSDGRKYLWYDDRVLPGHPLIMQQEQNRNRTVYLYSNFIERPAYFARHGYGGLPPSIPLANKDTEFSETSEIFAVPMKTTMIARFKNAFLGKNIDFSLGMWGFCFFIDGVAIGFVEFNPAKYGTPDGVYMMADFPVPGTKYKRLSRLIVMLAVSGEMRKTLERIKETRVRTLYTTAFTDRPVSMKWGNGRWSKVPKLWGCF